MFTNIIIPASVKAITRYVNVTITTNSNGNTTNIANATNHGAFQDMTSLTNVTFASTTSLEFGLKLLKVAQYTVSWRVELLIIMT